MKDRNTFSKKIFQLLNLGFFILMLSLIFHIVGIGCPIKWITGINCPGCGMTRAVWCLLHFKIRQAMYYHPLIWMLPVGVIFYLLWDRLSDINRKILIWGGIVIFITVYLVRLFNPDCTIVTAEIKKGIFLKILRRILVRRTK